MSKALETRIDDLEKQLAALKNAPVDAVLSEGIVQHIAGQIQTLFSNPVMLTGITSAILQNLQNALVFRAGHSKERQAQLVVNKHYVPGSQSLVLSAEGVLNLSTQMMPEGVDPVEATDGEWVQHVFQPGDAAEAALIQLMKSYAVEADEVRYLITDVDLQSYRENLTNQLNAQNANSTRESALAAAAS